MSALAGTDMRLEEVRVSTRSNYFSAAGALFSDADVVGLVIHTCYSPFLLLLTIKNRLGFISLNGSFVE
jgi:hypothetical protein